MQLTTGETWVARQRRARKRGGRPGHSLEDRTRQELYEAAKKKNVAGRSKMGTWELIKTLRKA
jgi:hypothetical protein